MRDWNGDYASGALAPSDALISVHLTEKQLQFLDRLGLAAILRSSTV